MATRLGGGAEFDRIRAIVKALGPRGSLLGNDVVLLPLGGEYLALSTDVSVEGVHFRRAWLDLEEIGWRAAAGALSDLAAVGARVLGVLGALTVPPETSGDAIARVMRGVDAAAGSVGGQLLGGDLSRGEAMSLAITVVGVTSQVMTRSGAKPGDGLWVTGELGGARAALTAWTAGRAPDSHARSRFARPEPRLAAGAWLVEHGATAMLDLSDGLGGDAGHLAAASGVALSIVLEQLPLDPAVPAEAELLGETAAEFAARGGEDYELLVAMPAGFEGTEQFRLTRIGMVSAGAGVALTLAGRPLTLRGYDHFA
jgi:thiamine-monophosphate kinase